MRDPRISLLFLVPGVGETIRINGRADIVVDPDLCESFAINGTLPRSVLVVTVDRIYFQCQKALVRSRLWDAEAQISRSDLPSTGKMLEALSEDGFDGETFLGFLLPVRLRLRPHELVTLELGAVLGQNFGDEDELDIAEPLDYWFHVEDYSGSHVILRCPGGIEPPPDIVRYAATLAAWHSKARGARGKVICSR